MKFIDAGSHDTGYHVLELTRRNLEILLAKLDDPLSAASMLAPGGMIFVKAVENDEHYSDREAGEMFMPTSGVML